jgi:hypothetical protein
MTDVPTLTSATAANYAVLNPLKTYLGTITNGNLQASLPSGGTAWGTMAVSTGKWYFEATITAVGSPSIGIIDTNRAVTDQIGSTASGSAAYLSDGRIRINSSTSGTYSSYTTNDVIGVAFDCDTPSVSFYKNNTLQATVTPTSGITYTSQCLTWNDGTSGFAMNFGQRPFAYTPPTGFVALNTFNLAASTIVKGNLQFDVTLWTGNDVNPRAITGLNFQPDFVWLKARSIAGQGNQIVDVVRGYGTSAMNTLITNQTVADESDETNIGQNVAYGNIQSLNSAGFTVDSGIVSAAQTNRLNETYVAWNWKAGGTAVTNTAGSISAQVSANPTAGFSVVVYTGNGTNGATVGHGLGVSPSMIIEKGRSTTYNWSVQGCGVMWTPATSTLFLNATNALNPSGAIAAPTSSVFTPSATLYANESGVSNVAYVFAEIAGFSKFGSYTGNGSADGPFVYTGFRSRFILIKRTDSTSPWLMYDTARDTYNQTNQLLRSNTNQAETGSGEIDILSNGFKYRGTSTNADYVTNVSGGTYVYMAFAENPFKNSLAR